MKIRIVATLAFLAVAPVAATAETVEDQQACMNDAFSICGHAIPDRDRVAACLAQNIRKLSSACRTVMQRHSKPGRSRSVATARN